MRTAMGRIVWMSVFVASTVFAEGRVGTLSDVAVIQNGHGFARVLFRAGGLADLGNVAISGATLRISTVGVPQNRAFELRVHPVTRAWNPASVEWTRGWTRPGGDFDDELLSMARLDLRGGAAEVAFDVTGLMKEILESGMDAHGFILTVAPEEGVGLRLEDLPRFAGLATASLDVRYRKMPPPPSRRGNR